MASLNIDVDDFTCTNYHKWDSRLTLSQWVSWLLNPHHHHFFFVVFLALCVLSFRARLDALGYASDFKNSKKSVSPYVSGFRFHFPPYGPLFGRSVLLQYLQALFSLFRSDCTPWQPRQPLLYRPLQFIRACIACSQALHILYVLIKYLSSAFLYRTSVLFHI